MTQSVKCLACKHEDTCKKRGGEEEALGTLLLSKCWGGRDKGILGACQKDSLAESSSISLVRDPGSNNNRTTNTIQRAIDQDT